MILNNKLTTGNKSYIRDTIKNDKICLKKAFTKTAEKLSLVKN